MGIGDLGFGVVCSSDVRRRRTTKKETKKEENQNNIYELNRTTHSAKIKIR